MIYSAMTDKEIVRQFENSENNEVAELCKRLGDNLMPDECLDCVALEGEISGLEEDAELDRSEKEKLYKRIELLEDGLKEIDPEHELLE